MKINRISLFCEYCNSKFSVIDSRKTSAKYCSAECYHLAKIGSHTKEQSNRICKNCGKITVTFPSSQKNLSFCSSSCQYEYLRGKNSPLWKGAMQETECKNCGNKITRRDSHIKKAITGNFCNMKCYGQWLSKFRSGENSYVWSGGRLPYYGLNWQNQRRLARHRDQYGCKCCKITENQLGKQLDVHHIRDFRLFGYVVGENENYKLANTLSNLISLCNSCHQKLERVPPDEFENQMEILRQSKLPSSIS